jgi:hypothetical protein
MSQYCDKCDDYVKMGDNPYCSHCYFRICSKLKQEGKEITHKNVMIVFNESTRAELYEENWYINKE